MLVPSWFGPAGLDTGNEMIVTMEYKWRELREYVQRTQRKPQHLFTNLCRTSSSRKHGGIDAFLIFKCIKSTCLGSRRCPQFVRYGGIIVSVVVEYETLLKMPEIQLSPNGVERMFAALSDTNNYLVFSVMSGSCDGSFPRQAGAFKSRLPPPCLASPISSGGNNRGSKR